jgi:outer membrane cobalamin receptor
MKHNFAMLFKYLAIIFVFSPLTGHADDDMDEFFSMSPAELAAVPITIATGTSRPSFRSAGSTSVVTAEQIKIMGATELHEILETVPGIHASLQSLTNDYQYSVRGIANKANAEMLILLNGTRITSPFQGSTLTGTELPVAAIERVEVVRGPGSAVYGADAFAGVINIITKKAKDIDGSQVGVRAGNWDTQSAWGQHGGQWAGWDIATSIQYQHTAGDSGRIIQSDSQTRLDNGFGTQASLAPSAMNTRFKALDSHLSLQRKHWDMNFWAFNVLDVGSRTGGAGALDPKGGADSAQYLGDVRFSTEDWSPNWEFLAHLSYLYAHVNANVNVFPNNAIVPIDALGQINFQSGSTAVPTAFANGLIEDMRHTQKIPAIELSSIYKGWDKHLFRLSAGLRYEEFTIQESSNKNRVILLGNNAPVAIGGPLVDVTGTPSAFIKDTSRTIGSLVLQDEWQIAKDWHLTAGVRYDYYSDFGSTVNPRFALAWDISNQLTTKLLYGKAFRAPTFTELYSQPFGNKNLKPENINMVEWAFDYRPFSSLRTALNLYYYRIHGLIMAPSINDISFSYQNSGGQDGYGTELEASWKLSEQLSLTGNYAWQYSHNKSTGLRVTGVPEHQVYFAATWVFVPQWQFQSQINWVGSRTREPGDNRPLKDYETIDFTLRGNKLWGHVNLAASLRNAFDANNFEPARNEMPVNLPLPGRSFYLEASVNF